MKRIKVLYIFRKKRSGFHSIENLFSSIQRHLPEDIEIDSLYLPYHEGIFSIIKNILFVFKQHKKIKSFDIVHITGDITYIGSFIFKPTIVTIHDIGSLGYGSSKLKRFFMNIFWIVFPSIKARKVTVISPFTQKELSSHYPFISKKIFFIPNCLSDEWIMVKRKSLGFSKNILTIGTKPNKNLDNILKALKNLDVLLIVVGRLKPNLVSLLENSKLDYVVYYDLPYKQMQYLYLQADVLLFVSTYEGFGMPIIEAQALGIPVITSNIEPMTSVAGEGALKVNPYDPEEIREAVLKLLSNKQLKEDFVKKGFLNVKRYLCSHISKQYAKLYNEIINQN